MATVRDLAAAARVSLGTVSRVLNGHPGVDEELRARVEAAIRQTGFRPNSRGRSLARKASGCIGLVLANRPVMQPFNAWLLNGVVQCCDERGYMTVFDRMQYSDTTLLTVADLPRCLRTEGAVDAVILAGTNYPNLTRFLDGLGMKYVVVGNSFVSTELPRMDQVRIDHAAGARIAVEYLLQLGHRDIWYLGDLGLPWYVERFEGYSAAMRDAGLQPQALIEGLSDDRFLNGLHSAEALLARNQNVTAIVGSTNEVAYGVWEAIERAGWNVPQDISLIGFDDEHTIHKSRPVTSLSVDPEHEGRELARMAIAKTAPDAKPAPAIVITPHLVKHSTCRPCSVAITA